MGTSKNKTRQTLFPVAIHKPIKEWIELRDGIFVALEDGYIIPATPSTAIEWIAINDVYNKEEDYTNFEKTDEFKWLNENAYKYGFILRYPKGKENITGYSYESWHYRYVGTDVAKKIHDEGITFDEYYAYYIEK